MGLLDDARRDRSVDAPEGVAVVDFAVHPDFQFVEGKEVPERSRILLQQISHRARYVAFQGLLFYCIENWRQYEQRPEHDPIRLHVQQLRQLLGSRLVVVPAEYALNNERADVHGPVYGAAVDAARAQGHRIGDDASAYAYGLTHSVCVPMVARSARQYFGFRDRVRVILALTDFDAVAHAERFEDIEAGYSHHVAFQRPILPGQ